jgi:hypothetical protein
MSHNDLVDIIEFIPILIFFINISIEWFKLGTSRNSHIQSFGREKALFVEKVKVILINQITKKLV